MKCYKPIFWITWNGSRISIGRPCWKFNIESGCNFLNLELLWRGKCWDRIVWKSLRRKHFDITRTAKEGREWVKKYRKSIKTCNIDLRGLSATSSHVVHTRKSIYCSSFLRSIPRDNMTVTYHHEWRCC